MSCVYRKGIFKPLPTDAEIITRKGVKLTRWRDRKGTTRTAPLTDDGRRVRIETATFFCAKYRDGNNHVVEVPTGCRDETAARQVLADLQRQAERVRAGLITAVESRTAEHFQRPIAEHFDVYLGSLEASGSVPMHRHNVRAYLDTLAAACGFRRLTESEAGSLGAMAGQRG